MSTASATTPGSCFSKRSVSRGSVRLSPHITIFGETHRMNDGDVTVGSRDSRSRSAPRERRIRRRNSTSDLSTAMDTFESLHKQGRRDSSPGEGRAPAPSERKLSRRASTRSIEGRLKRRSSSVEGPSRRRSSSVEGPRRRSGPKQKVMIEFPSSERPNLERRASIGHMPSAVTERTEKERRLSQIASRQMQAQRQQALQKVAGKVNGQTEEDKDSKGEVLTAPRHTNELPYPKSLYEIFPLERPQPDDPLYESTAEDDESLFSVFQWSITEKKGGNNSPSPTGVTDFLSSKSHNGGTAPLPPKRRTLPALQSEAAFPLEKRLSTRCFSVSSGEDGSKKSSKSRKSKKDKEGSSSDKKSKKKKKSKDDKRERRPSQDGHDGRERRSSNEGSNDGSYDDSRDGSRSRSSRTSNTEGSKRRHSSRRRGGSVPLRESRRERQEAGPSKRSTSVMGGSERVSRRSTYRRAESSRLSPMPSIYAG